MSSAKKKQEPEKNKSWLPAILAILCAVAVLAVGASMTMQEQEETTQPTQPSQPDPAYEWATHIAVLEVENYGTITMALDGNAAPETVANFVKLAQEGFYDGLTFHRIYAGFMIQGGDPDADGTGGSGTAIPGEFASNGFDNPLSHTRGAVSMARTIDPDSATSQFFIVHEDSTFLDGDYAAFGYVTEGMEVVDKLCADARPIDGNGSIARDQQPVIASLTVTEIG